MTGTRSLLGLGVAELEPVLAGLPAVRPFTARQLERWLFERRAASFAEMSDLPQPLRQALGERYRIDPFSSATAERGDDGTTKYLLGLDDGARIEAVAMPGDDRTTYCLSAQAGCAADCAFCVTGRFGPGRNLEVAEIVGQYLMMTRPARPESVNIVFMGMGEPTANLDNVRRAFDCFRREVSPRRITLSTVGSVPGIDAIAAWDVRPNLAVSITAASDELRSRLMPVNRAWNLAALHAALARFPLEPRRRITLEYVLIAATNDSEAQARELARWARGLEVKVNLIPLNEDSEHLPGFHRSSEAAIDAFCRVLTDAGLPVTVRRSRGRTAAAACGQLRGRAEANRRRKHKPQNNQ